MLALGPLLTLQACATPPPAVYGPISDTVPYGYRDRPNPDGGHTLLTALPVNSSLAEARTFWDRRAAELCPGGVAKQIVFRSDRKEVMAPAGYAYNSVSFSTRATTGFEIEGYIYCKAAKPGG